MKAVERQHKDCVAILLEHGASPDLKGPGGNTALHLAAVIPNKSLVELLLAHKAHIDAQNELGYTPLTLAITEHCEEMVEFLLQKGADVHARDNRKRTTLMLAACAGDMNIIQILLHHGADLSHQDPFGCTAEYYAREFQHDDIADQLEKYMFYEGMGECFARGTEGPAVDGRFCSALTAEFTSGAPAGVLPAAAGAEEEKDEDSWSDFELDSEDLKKESAGILLPPADEHRAHVHSGAEERGNGVLPLGRAEQEEGFDSCSENKVLFLREKWVMRLQQELADALRKNSLAEASPEAKKCYSRDLQEQKLRLQKELDRSKAKLQEVKERYICTECYAESLKNAIKEKELTTSRNLQAILAMPSAAVAIPELEEQVQQLQVVMARLEATAQQQAKTTEALQKDQQASASRESEIEEVKNLAVMKCQTEAPLKKMWRRNIAMEQERTRLKNLLESSDKAECYVRGKRQIPGRDEEYLF